MNRICTATLAVTFAAILTGCATAPVATYRHPETHNTAVCQRENPGYATGLFGLLDILTVIDQTLASHRYATCKTDLERQGYTRSDK